MLANIITKTRIYIQTYIRIKMKNISKLRDLISMRCRRRRKKKLDSNTEKERKKQKKKKEKDEAEKRRKLADRDILGGVDWKEAVEPYFYFYSFFY